MDLFHSTAHVSAGPPLSRQQRLLGTDQHAHSQQTLALRRGAVRVHEGGLCLARSIPLQTIL